MKVLKHIRHKYGCPCCEQADANPNIATAAKPVQPIAKGLAGPSLLAYVITSKLGDHLPLYRLEKIFARHQVETGLALDRPRGWAVIAAISKRTATAVTTGSTQAAK